MKGKGKGNQTQIIQIITFDYSEAFVKENGIKIKYSDDSFYFNSIAYSNTGANLKIIEGIKEIVTDEILVIYDNE